MARSILSKEKKEKKDKKDKKQKKKRKHSSSSSGPSRSPEPELSDDEVEQQLLIQLSLKPKACKLRQCLRYDDLLCAPRLLLTFHVLGYVRGCSQRSGGLASGLVILSTEGKDVAAVGWPIYLLLQFSLCRV